MAVVLIITTQNGAQTELSLDSSTIILGRSSSSTLKLSDPKISGKHCAIKKIATGKVLVKDLDTTNGTYLNGGKITETQLFCDDAITIGDISIQIDQTKLTPKEKKVLVRDEPTVQVKFVDLDGRTAGSPPKPSEARKKKVLKEQEQKDLDDNFTQHKVDVDTKVQETKTVAASSISINDRGEALMEMEDSTGATKMIKIGKTKKNNRNKVPAKVKKIKKKKSIMTKIKDIFSKD
jgi:pSer/pThr/pTyr-binding forkhead associated (FHA) protein